MHQITEKIRYGWEELNRARGIIMWCCHSMIRNQCIMGKLVLRHWKDYSLFRLHFRTYPLKPAWLASEILWTFIRASRDYSNPKKLWTVLIFHINRMWVMIYQSHPSWKHLWKNSENQNHLKLGYRTDSYVLSSATVKWIRIMWDHTWDRQRKEILFMSSSSSTRKKHQF